MPDYTAHETAIIDEGARIGKGSRIWHWVLFVQSKDRRNVSLGQNVFVGNKVDIEIIVKYKMVLVYMIMLL